MELVLVVVVMLMVMERSGDYSQGMLMTEFSIVQGGNAKITQCDKVDDRLLIEGQCWKHKIANNSICDDVSM